MYLTKVRGEAYPSFSRRDDRPRKQVTMSVAVGLSDHDFNYVVLCSDRQMTDANAGLKFEECKIFFAGSQNLQPFVHIPFAKPGTKNVWRPFWRLGFSYVGDPDAAQNTFGTVVDAVQAAYREEGEHIDECCALDFDFWRNILLPVFASKDAKRLQTLIAFQSLRRCFLFKTKADQVVLGERECVGGGDTSVLRYFADVVSRTDILTSDNALTVGVYLVSLANRYVDGCGLGINALIFENEKEDRHIGKKETEKYSERFAQFERQIEKGFFGNSV
jgi:hypothetical protein